MAYQHRITALLAGVAVLMAADTALAAPSLTQRKLASADSRPFDAFGNAVDVSGTTAIVGAYHNHDHESPGEVGAAYVYVRSGKAWTPQAKLKAPDGQDGDWFGARVAISGSTAAIGAANANAVYIFVRSSGTWTLQQKLPVYGNSLSLSGSTLVVPQGQTVRVYTRSGSTWSLQQTLTQGNGDTFDWAAVDGSAVVATAGHGGGTPRVYVYTRAAAVWTLRQTLVAPLGEGFDQADVSGLTVAVAGSDATGRGVVDVYTPNGGGIWTRQQQLTSSAGSILPQPLPADVAGSQRNVAISGATIVAGGRDPARHGGVAFVFTRSAGVWTQQKELSPTTNASSDAFAAAVGISGSITVTGSTIVAGAPGTSSHTGVAYAFTS